MWRIIILGALGIVIGTRARSEKSIIVSALVFGLVYGGSAAVSASFVTGPLSPSRVAYYLVLGLVMAAPVYAIAEIWRRTRVRAWDWIKRLLRS